MEVLKFSFIFCVIFGWNTASAGYVKLVHTNTPCKNNSDCREYSDSYCYGNTVCSCKKGYEFDLWDDVCIPKEIDLKCKQDYDCFSKVEQSYCSSAISCRCKAGYVASKNKAACLSVSKLHSNCQEDVQCKAKHSSCHPQSQQCVCDSGYHEGKGSHECIPDIVKECHPLVSAFDPKVAGSKAVSIEEIPYMLQIENRGGYICGASLLKPNYAISAAHCFKDLDESYVTVRAGTSYQNDLGEVVGVSKIIMHESYDNKAFDFDIAILRLAKNLEIGPKIQTIDINTGDTPVEGTKARVSGWGKTSQEDLGSYCLRSAAILVQNRAICSSNYAPEVNITERMFCAGDEGKDTCGGDSGGPLVIDGKLAGITSFGKGCGRIWFPGIYVNVAALADWITRTISENPDAFSLGNHESKVKYEKIYEIGQNYQKDIIALNETHQKDIISVKETIKTLEMDDFDLLSRAISNSVDILGVPEMPNENLYDIVAKIATLLDVRNITSEDISTANRVIKKTTRTRLITAQFISRKKWEDFFKAATDLHLVFSRDIVPETSTDENMRISVFESMSLKHKKLFDACRKKARLYGLKYLAYTVGKFYLKKNEEDKDAIIISYPHELDQINEATVRTPQGELWGKVPDLPTLRWFEYNDFFLIWFIVIE